MKSIATIACVLFAFINYAQTGRVGIGTSNPQAQLHTTGDIRFDTLAGSGKRQLYADANGNITAAPVFKNPTVINIPNATCDGIVSAINVSGQPAAINPANIRVKININHPMVSQLSVQLIAPNNQVLVLSSYISGAHFSNTIFWDGATRAISQGEAPYTGSFRPRGGSPALAAGCTSPNTLNMFSQFGGGSIVPNGQWRLRVTDKETGSGGQLLNWSISFDGSEPGINPVEWPALIPAEGINTPQTGAANMLAVAYGIVYSNATTSVSSSSNNCELWHSVTGVYVISFTGSNLRNVNIGTLPVLVSLYGGSPGMISFYGEEGKITVTTFNSSGQPTDRGFSFAVYKP